MSESARKNLSSTFDKLLINDTTFDDIQEIALENAKRLSVDKEFQDAIIEWRNKWEIKIESYNRYIHPQEEHLFPPSYKHPLPSPESIWERGTAQFTTEQRRKQRQELADIGKKSGLDFFGNDYGLLTVAAFYTLTPEVVTNRWDQIYPTIIQYMTTAVRMYVYPYIHPFLRERYAAVINHLIIQLEKHGISLDLPDAAESFIFDIRDKVYLIDWEKDPEPEIILKIDLNSSKNDVSRIWDHVSFQQARLWPGSIKKTRKWRNYERDYFIWKKVKKEGFTYEDAFDIWLNEHSDDRIVEISAVIKGAQLINKVYG
jgi:hypothetical protein